MSQEQLSPEAVEIVEDVEVDPSDFIQAAADLVSDLKDDLPDGYRLTLVARYTGPDVYEDIVVGTDNLVLATCALSAAAARKEVLRESGAEFELEPAKRRELTDQQHRIIDGMAEEWDMTPRQIEELRAMVEDMLQ